MSGQVFACLLLGLALAAALWWVWGAVSDGVYQYRVITRDWPDA